MVYVFKGNDTNGNEHIFIVHEQTYPLAYKKLIYELNRRNIVLTNLWRHDNDGCNVHTIF